MSRIRAKNTKPELFTRSMLHRMGYRYRLHVKELPGKPDIVLPKYHTVVFVNGCFWHGHRGCKYAYKPKSRESFWSTKFKDNMKRDNEVSQQLNELGWKVLVIWECETSDFAMLENKITSFLKTQKENGNGYTRSITAG